MTEPPIPLTNAARVDGSSRADVLFAAALVLLMALFVTHAWVVDDAYITLRTVDNFVHGHGLRWNVAERVQVYTHPLWMFVLTAAYAVTRESFVTTIAVSFAISLVAVLAAGGAVRGAHRQEAGWRKALLVAVLLGSKAFLDFSSSGLENPLTHLLLALFFLRFLFPEVPWPQAPRRQVTWLFLIAALGFVNRQDTALLFFPACLLVLQAQWRARGRAVLRSLGLGLAPAIAWLLFALVYYGSVVPNTAYAKLIGPRLSAPETLQAGAAYFLDSVYLDFATLPLIALALYLCSRRRSPALISAAAGIVLYLAYVLIAGAAGTHMSGRFFSAPLFLSAILIAVLVRDWRQAIPIAGLTALILVASPYSPLKVGTSYYATQKMARPDGIIIDTRDYVLQEGAALLDVPHRGRMPAHGAYLKGLEWRKASGKVSVGGPPPFANMVGYSGFAAGPDKHIIDALALTDPLLAHLPVERNADWRPGHFFRMIPAGYVASIEKDANLIEDPDLRAYYEAVRVITRAPLFSGLRLGTLIRFAAGGYDRHLQAFATRNKLRW